MLRIFASLQEFVAVFRKIFRATTETPGSAFVLQSTHYKLVLLLGQCAREKRVPRPRFSIGEVELVFESRDT